MIPGFDFCENKHSHVECYGLTLFCRDEIKQFCWYVTYFPTPYLTCSANENRGHLSGVLNV